MKMASNQTHADVDINLVAANDDEMIEDVEGLNEGGDGGVREEDVVGMVFDSVNEAEKFYKDYARKMGFGVRSNSTVLDHNSGGKLIVKEFCCEKEGYRRNKRNVEESQNKKKKRRPKPETRTGYAANFRVKLDEESNKWVVKCFKAEHNHELVINQEKLFIRSNRF